MSAAGYAHRRGVPWWSRPPAPAIEDTTFSGDAEDGALRTIVTTGRRVTSTTRTDIDDGTFTATVAAGDISIDPITLVGEDGSAVTITLDPATLARNFFNSTFFAEGVASITVTDDSTDPPTDTVTEIPVVVIGSISQKNGEYRLRAEVRGLLTASGSGTATYSLLKLELEAETDIPTTTGS
jgi:hypothetical protein